MTDLAGWKLPPVCHWEQASSHLKQPVHPGVAAPRLIIPVLWDKPSRLPERLPPAVSDIQYSHADFGRRYAADGLAHLMKLRLDAEVESFARMTSVTEDVLRVIAHNRGWMKRYPIVVALTKNPSWSGSAPGSSLMSTILSACVN